MPERRNLGGIVMMLLAVALLSLMDAGLKTLSPHYSPFQVGALRGAASWPFAVLWILSMGGRRTLRTLFRVRWSLHLFRGVLGVMMMSAFIYGVRELPLTEAYTIFFVAPLFITALSVPLLGERVGAARWLAIGAGFVGVLVALRPSTAVFNWAGLAVLAGAAGYAVSAITVRVLARTDSTQSMVFWLLTLMTLGCGLLALPEWRPLQPEHRWLVLGIGIVGVFGQYCITEAFARAEASVVAPLEYSALAWGLGFDLLVWSVLPDGMTWVGAGIIVASGLYLIRQERRHKSMDRTAASGV